MIYGFTVKSAVTLSEENLVSHGCSVCVSWCRCARGSVRRCRGAPPVSSRAVPLLPRMEGWRTEEWEGAGERPRRTLKLATATFPSVHFHPPPLLLLLHPPLPPYLLTAAVGWVFMPISRTVQTRPPAACITMTTARREVLMLLIT